MLIQNCLSIIQYCHILLAHCNKNKFYYLKVSDSNLVCGVEKCSLDYEVDPSLTLTIKVKDDGTPALSMTKSLVIQVGDRNDAPGEVRLAGDSVRENEPAGISIGWCSNNNLVVRVYIYSLTGKVTKAQNITLNLKRILNIQCIT